MKKKIERNLLILCSVAMLASIQAHGQNRPLVIEGGTLIDGRGGTPLKNSVIVIEGSRIKAVGTQGQVSYPQNALVIQAQGQSILPGLIDSHIHFLDFTPPLFLHFGVTTVFDTANRTDWILAQREALKKGRIKGPRLFVTGWVIDGPRHRTDMTATPERGGYRTHVNTVEEARMATRDMIRQGVDAIKVHEGLTLEMLKTIIEEAHSAGLEVVGHTHNPREAVLAGLNFIEHGEPLPYATIGDPEKLRAAQEGRLSTPEADMDPRLFDPLIDLFISNGVYLNPTLSRSWINVMPKRSEWSELAAKILEDRSMRFIPKARLQFWLQTAKAADTDISSPQMQRRLEGFRRVEEFTRRYAQAGGRVLTGPDTGSSSGPTNIPGLSMHIEMEALVDAGLTPMQAILGSTKWAAEFFHLERDLGTVEPGKLADLILIEGDPLADIRATREIRAVILDGQLIDTRFDQNFRNPMPRPVALDSVLEYMGPEILEIAPKIAQEGDSKVDLEVSGKKFSPRSLIRFDTTDLPTVFVSQSRLTGNIDGALLKEVGTYAVTVVNPGSGGGTSNVQYFVVKFPD